MTEITWEHIKKNRRSSLAVMTAVLLSATLLCSICIFAHAFWSASVEMTRYNGGDWHGELFDNTPGEMLPYIEGNPNVESVMIKGAWQAVQLPEGTAMPYLFLRDTNEAYWRNMSEQHTLMEGRLPERTGEIAVSKLFFDRNPDYHIGDTLTLAKGQRMLDDEILSIQSIRLEGETFRQTAEETFTIVGKLDLTTTTAYPGYYALGYLEREAIAPEDMLTIYLRFHSMRDTYRVLPEIAEAVGYETDEFGDYALRYNAALLGLHGVSDGATAMSFSRLAIWGMVALAALLLIATFALIIRSVFSLSAGARIQQLGMLRSTGASPGQIRSSILLEGLTLSALPLLLAVLLAYVFSQAMGRVYLNIMGDMIHTELDFGFSVPVAALGVLVSLASVLLAVRSTARKMARLTPIEAVRGKNSQNLKRKKERNHRLSKRVFGYPGVLAQDNLRAYQKIYRMPVAALCLSFVLVAGTLCMIGIARVSNEAAYAEDYFDAQAYLYIAQERDENLIHEIRTMEGVQESVASSSVGFGMAVPTEMESEEFSALGGFAGVDKSKYNVVEHGDGWRIHGTLLGLDAESFRRYCGSLGLDAGEYLNAERPMAIAVNAVRPTPDARKKEDKERTIPFLRLEEGAVYTLDEQTYADTKSSHTFDVEVGAVTQEHPVTDAQYSNYRIILVLPLSQYDKIVEDFLPERALLYRRTNVLLKTTLDGITAEERLDRICEAYLGSEDFGTYSRDGELKAQQTSNTGLLAMASGIALVFALIGISNAFSTVSGNLAMRRRDFAMLRSAGLDDAGFGRVLFIEGLFFSLRPILLAVPLIGLLCALFGYLLDLPLASLLGALPFGAILLYAAGILLAMGLAYLYGARNIRKGTIVDALRSGLV
ncbi:FtsX-like permease family protein [Ruminococcaceae bacterium OttesenSCG-928-L11]|nr:FtsX-like permease family protein [Ruminococcaceae bacterium OttesenSCG-928-L11]